MDYGKTTLTAASTATLGSAAFGSYLMVVATLLLVVVIATGIRFCWRRDKALSER